MHGEKFRNYLENTSKETFDTDSERLYDQKFFYNYNRGMSKRYL